MRLRLLSFVRVSILLLSLLGAINAAYTLNLRSQLLSGTTTSSFCDISSKVSCSSALTNPQFTFFGFPFCEVALLMYPILIALALWSYKKPESAFTTLSILGAMGVLFSGYSVYIQGWVISTWCPLCLVCSVIISLIALLSWIVKAKI